MKFSRLPVVLLRVFLPLILFGTCLAQVAPQAPVTLNGAPMGGVKFDHASHLKVAAKCEVCHHASKAAKPLKSQHEACTDCHTKPATPPVTTGVQAAFHNPSATRGLCIDCHKTENLNGKAAPVKCADCHKKDSA